MYAPDVVKPLLPAWAASDPPVATVSVEALADEELMRRYRQGSERAFRALFSRHTGRIYGYFVRITGNKELSQDLTQQTWLHVHRARHSFVQDSHFTPWIYRIATNLMRDHFRTRGHAVERLTVDGALPECESASAGDEHLGVVRRALLSLPENYREVIVLHRWHDMHFAEIASVLGVSEGAVRTRAHRGYLRLRELLLQERLS